MFIAGQRVADEVYPDVDAYVHEEAAKWISCPDCGSDDAGFMYWGEGCDMNFKCPDCEKGYGLR